MEQLIHAGALGGICHILNARDRCSEIYKEFPCLLCTLLDMLHLQLTFAGRIALHLFSFRTAHHCQIIAAHHAIIIDGNIHQRAHQPSGVLGLDLVVLRGLLADQCTDIIRQLKFLLTPCLQRFFTFLVLTFKQPLKVSFALRSIQRLHRGSQRAQHTTIRQIFRLIRCAVLRL